MPPIATPSLDTPDLLDWAQAIEAQPWRGILVGNGASIAVWERFSYPSLYRHATTEIRNRLTSSDRALFDAFDTQNFEQVLSSLKVAGTVSSALGREVTYLKERYDSVQRALFEAVHSVHVPWGYALSFSRTLKRMRAELRKYRFVYSTNYDLLIYWAVMQEGNGEGFVDFFWNPGLSFDRHNVNVYLETDTRVLYLHGGIHLRRTMDGHAFKSRAAAKTLLGLFTTSFEERSTPLLVSEGDAQDKYRAILRTDYLEFAYEKFEGHKEGLVVLGHSLGVSDDHLVDAIKTWKTPAIAISIRRGDAEAIIQRKAHIRDRLPHANLYFFKSETHPLAEPSMRVKRLSLPFGST